MGNRRDLISVVMAARNAEKYIHESLSSLLRQTHQNLEIIVVDDYSTDSTVDIVNSFRDSRISVVALAEHTGQAGALGVGVAQSSGTWIARQDADDVSQPIRFALQLAVARIAPANTILGTSARFFGNRRGITLKRVTHTQLHSQSLFHSPLIHSSLFSHRENFETFPYDASFLRAQDYDWIERNLSAGAQLLNIPLPLVNYRVHNQMVSVQQRARSKHFVSIVHRRIFEQLGAEWQGNELDIHFALARKDPSLLPKDATEPDVVAWAKKLVRANSGSKLFSGGSMKRNLYSRVSQITHQIGA